MTTSKKLFLGAFLVLITVPFFGRLALRGTTPGIVLPSENRTITAFTMPKKTFRRSILREWFVNNDRWITDRLAKREKVITSVNALLANPKWFTSSDFSKGLFGKEGFLFLGNSYEGVIDRHFSPQFTIGKEGEANLVNYHKTLQSVAKEVGAFYIVFAAPDKHGIYCEKFASWATGGNACKRVNMVTNRFKALLEREGIPVSYPFEEIRKANGETIYYKADTHWKRTGAEIGFKTLMKNLADRGVKFSGEPYRPVPPGIYSFEKRPIGLAGDLRNIIGVPRDFKNDDYDIVLKSNEPVLYSVNGATPARVPAEQALVNGVGLKWISIAQNEAAPNKARVLVFGDSFSTAMGPFFHFYFTEARYYARHGRDYEAMKAAIREVKPDIVVYETVERGLR